MNTPVKSAGEKAASNEKPVFQAGEKFGDYVVQRCLSDEKTSVVYLVKSEMSGHSAVIQVFSKDFDAGDPDYKQQFLREVEYKGNASTDGLVPLVDIGRDPDTLFAYLIMKWEAGDSLRKKMETGHRFPVPEALNICKSVARALYPYGGCRTLYRTVSPDHIFLSQDGKGVRLSNYGIDVPVWKGRSPYFAPERKEGNFEVEDPAVIYSIGVTLWEMVGGGLPKVVDLKSGESPDIRTSIADIDKPLADLIARLIDKDATKRVQTMFETVQKIEELLVRIGTIKSVSQEKPPSPLKRSRTNRIDPVSGVQQMRTFSHLKAIPRSTFKPMSQTAAPVGPSMPSEPVAAQRSPGFYVMMGALSSFVVMGIGFALFYHMMTMMMRQVQPRHMYRQSVETVAAGAQPLQVQTRTPTPNPTDVGQKMAFADLNPPKDEKRPVEDNAKADAPRDAKGSESDAEIIPSSVGGGEARDPNDFPEPISPELKLYSAFRGNADKGETSDAEAAVLDAVNAARALDPDMRIYDLNGNANILERNRLSGESLNVIRTGKVFLVMELLRRQCPSILQKYDLEKMKFILTLPTTRELTFRETALILSRAAGRDVSQLFRTYGVKSGLESGGGAS